ncbi:MAG: SIR2 family NAD-dependent protein deacylase [Candidatus Syntropharchaeia archaeon]
MEDIKKAAEILKKSKSVVVLTGAGISAESGVPTFRGKDGLWKKYRAEDLATPRAFSENPKLVWEWYNWRREIISRAEPNPAHLIVAKMEKYYEDFWVITQNVDGLHRKAGNKKIIELHGNIWRVRCTEEGKVFEMDDVPLPEIPPRCECGALLRPDVVWFGESLSPDDLSRSFECAEKCEVMLVVGTSAVVYPAASLPSIAKKKNAYLIEVNMEETPISSIADVSIFGKAGEIMPKIFPG